MNSNSINTLCYPRVPSFACGVSGFCGGESCTTGDLVAVEDFLGVAKLVPPVDEGTVIG